MKYITIFAETNEHIKTNRPINKIVNGIVCCADGLYIELLHYFLSSESIRLKFGCAIFVDFPSGLWIQKFEYAEYSREFKMSPMI